MNDPAAPASHQLAVVVRDLAALIEGLTDAAATARGLSAATDWQSSAATAFHEKAELWAGQVSGLICLAETARIDAAHARDRAAFREADAYAAAFAPAGAR
ncbi:hypothetical protein K0817_017010 [Microbacterium sp. HD4P20]|uniref:hypothetical protein n=1 Tax=Microbacterium sp. HD4P20 TaxID=2864874 RepID=UPI001C640449|nr:hypothetical protein [Microbacterium sp. HD4P20]MCP2638256.1 hypothetical protein [Microbacterium sp. HD4P20]